MTMPVPSAIRSLGALSSAGNAPAPPRNPRQNPFDSTWISYKVRVQIRVTCRSQIQNQRNKINEIAGNQ